LLQAADILAGPILRRVEHDLVSVWIALTKPANVEIEVFRGQGVSGSLGPAVGRKNPASTLDTHTIAAGKHLHVVVSIWEPASPAGLDLGQIHSYDLVIKADDDHEETRLRDLGLLSDGEATVKDIARLKELKLLSEGEGFSTPRWFALGYQKDWLPSFAMVPAAVADLKIVQGSCRGSDKPGRDAFPSLDDFLRGVLTDERLRPHMLFLTGDQIYADEAPAEQLDMLLSVSASLLGTQETIPIDFKKTKTEEPATITYPLDATHLPPGRRGHPLLEIAGFTSPNLDSHVMGFGEYCAFYLAGWSDVTWNWNPNALLKARKEPFEAYVRATESIYRRAEDYAAKNPDEDGDALEEMIPYHDAWRLVPAKYRVIDAVLSADDRDALWGKDKAHKEDEKRFFLWKRFWATMPPDDDPIPHQEDESSLPPGTNTKEERNRLARALTPSWFAGVRYFGVPHTPPKKGEDGAPGKLVTKKDMVYNKVHRLDWFYKDLPRVKRLLANIPSYMVFDDHDVTDDWNITPRWAKQTRASALGRAVLRNGLAACTLFQSWGNDPRAYREEIPRRVLELIARLFASPAPAQPGPDPAAAGELERLFDLVPLPAGPPPPRMTWHFRYDGPGFEVIALDSRTWRGFEPEANETIRSEFSADATATLLTDEALRLQIPEQPPIGVGRAVDLQPPEPPPEPPAAPPPDTNADGICFVIAATPVLGYPVIESVVQPLVNLNEIVKVAIPHPPFVRWQKAFSLGRVKNDPENWGFVPSLFEAVLARLSTRRTVVFLSGDVHYAFTIRMAYWQMGPDWQPGKVTRVIQATASSFRAQRNDLAPIIAIDLAQQLGGLTTSLRRLGWHRGAFGTPEASPPLVKGEKPFSPHLESLLGLDPIVVSPSGIPPTTKYLRGPEWAWETTLAPDTRPDEERLGDLHPPPFSKESQIDMVRSVAERHLWQAQNAMPRGWHLWTNFTIIDFTTNDEGKLDLLRHFVYGFDPQSTGPDMKPYLIAEVPIAVNETPPQEPEP
jgi:hypothetical protein